MKNKIQILLVLSLIILFLTPQQQIYGTTCKCSLHQNHDNMNSVLWFQQSAEADALYYQGFHLARLKLDKARKQYSDKKKAIILDVDETVLNNSPLMAHLIKQGISFEDGWDQWVKKAEAKPLPGSLEFLNYANQLGIQIFYITNREQHLYKPTEMNLKKEGFPQVNPDHLLMKEKKHSKEERRQKILRSYDVVLFLGDNLIDLSKNFDGKTAAERKTIMKSMEKEFEDRFIVFPNPMYGDWEKSLYLNSKNLSDKNSIIKAYQ